MTPNRPRWRGQPRFFEIWFLVVFDPGARRAWWLRYTTFAPASDQAGAPRATVWAAAFETGRPAVVLKRIHPISAYAGDGDGIRIGDCVLADGVARGRVDARGHAIGWDLGWTPTARPVRRGPWLLDRLPTPTHVVHAHDGLRCSGWVTVDGVRREIAAAPGLQKHIWGMRRVEELSWIYCPRFVEEPRASLEATAVRLRHGRGPRLVSVWARAGGEEHRRWGLRTLVASRMEVSALGEVRARAASLTRALEVRAWCDPRTLAGYIYRDPAGRDLHVAQSDVGSCELDLLVRPTPLAPWVVDRRLTSRDTVAIEFHQPDPMAGVEYVGWDDAHTS